MQLFDLKSDPGETTNKQAEYLEVVAELTNELRQVIQRGRSTPGPKQTNHPGSARWPDLP